MPALRSVGDEIAVRVKPPNLADSPQGESCAIDDRQWWVVRGMMCGCVWMWVAGWVLRFISAYVGACGCGV